MEYKSVFDISVPARIIPSSFQKAGAFRVGGIVNSLVVSDAFIVGMVHRE